MSSNVIVAHDRAAGDSVDFHARHGRALQARATREAIELVLALYRSWRHRGAIKQRGWQVEWPTEPRPSH